METDLKIKLKTSVMDSIDLSGEIRDEDISQLIDRCISEMTDTYIPLREKVDLKREIFNSIRRLDVLSELLEDDSITEIMINGPDNIFYERSGSIYKSEKHFEDGDRLMSVIQQIVGEANRMVNETTPIEIGRAHV